VLGAECLVWTCSVVGDDDGSSAHLPLPNHPKPTQSQQKKLSNVPNLVKVAKDSGLPLRITEAATLSYGGVQGISDTTGAALWSLDTALEVANAGGAGIHYHQVLSRENNANYNA